MANKLIRKASHGIAAGLMLIGVTMIVVPTASAVDCNKHPGQCGYCSHPSNSFSGECSWNGTQEIPSP